MKRTCACVVAWLTFGLWCDLGPNGYAATTMIIGALIAVSTFGAVVLDLVDRGGRR